MQKYYKYHDLTMSQFYTQGGIGNIYISKYGKYVYKLTYSASAFTNNILTFNKLVNKIPCSNLLDYCRGLVSLRNNMLVVVFFLFA